MNRHFLWEGQNECSDFQSNSYFRVERNKQPFCFECPFLVRARRARAKIGGREMQKGVARVAKVTFWACNTDYFRFCVNFAEIGSQAKRSGDWAASILSFQIVYGSFLGSTNVIFFLFVHMNEKAAFSRWGFGLFFETPNVKFLDKRKNIYF